jgi:hypothetical protein
MKDMAVTNSFGMPSRTPQYLKEDIPKAQASLKDGQMMIVSVVGMNFFVSFVQEVHPVKSASLIRRN